MGLLSTDTPYEYIMMFCHLRQSQGDPATPGPAPALGISNASSEITSLGQIAAMIQHPGLMGPPHQVLVVRMVNRSEGLSVEEQRWPIRTADARRHVVESQIHRPDSGNTPCGPSWVSSTNCTVRTAPFRWRDAHFFEGLTLQSSGKDTRTWNASKCPINR